MRHIYISYDAHTPRTPPLESATRAFSFCGISRLCKGLDQYGTPGWEHWEGHNFFACRTGLQHRLPFRVRFSVVLVCFTFAGDVTAGLELAASGSSVPRSQFRVFSIPADLSSRRVLCVTGLRRFLPTRCRRSFSNLACFSSLQTLVLDKNDLEDIKACPTIPTLTTLWFNNNRVKRGVDEGLAFQYVPIFALVPYVWLTVSLHCLRVAFSLTGYGLS